MLKLLKFKDSIKKKVKEVSLSVEGEEPPLKVSEELLIRHSNYFRDLTRAEFKKHRKTKLEETSYVALKKIVEFMYQYHIDFQDNTEALETLRAAHKYGFTALQDKCVDYLKNIVEVINVCDIFETAVLLSLGSLKYSCLRLIDEYPEEVFASRSFLSLQISTVQKIISRSSLNITTEKSVFDAVLGWGLNNILREGLDPNEQEIINQTVITLLPNVRFSVMTKMELDDPEVAKYISLISCEEFGSKRRTISDASLISTRTIDSISLHSREYVTRYVSPLNIYHSFQHTIKTGETFCLRIEILKGTVFLTGVTLAVRVFAATKDTACLYVVLTATNVVTSEQVTKRGAFMNTDENASLDFPTPLVAKESERIEIALCAKKVENVCPFTMNNDFQILMPESQKIAMKVVTSNISSPNTIDNGRCIFKEIEYFF